MIARTKFNWIPYVRSYNKLASTAKSESHPQRRKNTLCNALDTICIMAFERRTSKQLSTLQRRRDSANHHATSMRSTTTLLWDNDQTRKWISFPRPRKKTTIANASHHNVKKQMLQASHQHGNNMRQQAKGTITVRRTLLAAAKNLMSLPQARRYMR